MWLFELLVSVVCKCLAAVIIEIATPTIMLTDTDGYWSRPLHSGYRAGRCRCGLGCQVRSINHFSYLPLTGPICDLQHYAITEGKFAQSLNVLLLLSLFLYTIGAELAE